MRLHTQNLQMEFWTLDLVRQALVDKHLVGQTLGVQVPADWPNADVRKYVLPYLFACLEKGDDAGPWGGPVIHSADQAIIGTMGFKEPLGWEGILEIGYDIVPAYQGHGYATEMAQGLVPWALQQPGVRLIKAECLTSNAASIRVLEKVGMRRRAQDEDMIYWELQRD